MTLPIKKQLHNVSPILTQLGLLLIFLLFSVTGSLAQPFVTATTPNSNATNVDPNEDIIINFNQGIQNGILTNDYLEIYKSGTLMASFNSDDFSEGILLFSDKVILNNHDDGGSYQALPEITEGLFEASSSYTIVVKSGFVRSSDGLMTNNSQHTFSFTTASIPNDGEPPTPITFFPDNTTSFSPTQDLRVTFSESIQKGSGVVRLYLRDYGNISSSTADDSNTLLQELDINSSAITIENNNTLVIDFPSDLPSNSNSLGGSAGAELFIYIQSTASGFAAIEDLQGNGMNFNFPTSITMDPVWKFNTSDDSTSPTIVSKIPADNATGVDISSNLSFTLNEVVFKGTGNVLVRRTTDDVIVESIDISSATLSNSSTLPKTVTVPISDLEYGTEYYVQIDEGTLRDLSYNLFDGIDNSTLWNFTTEVAVDGTAPLLISSTPNDNDVDVAASTNVILNFNEDILLVNTSSLQLRRSDDNVEVAASKSVIGNTLTINPSVNLDEGASYYVHISNDAISDLAGNNFDGITTNTEVNFTTEDNSPPIISSTTPVDDSNDIAINSDIVIAFNENIIITNHSNIQLRRADNSEVVTIKSVSDAILTINPTIDLNSSTEYYIFIANGAIEDLAGNGFSGITTTTGLNFSTGDNIPPAPTSYFPIQGATQVPLEVEFRLTFSENINPGTGTIQLKRYDNDQTIQTISATTASSNLSFGINFIDINPTNDLEEGLEYYITCTNCVQDDSGNLYTGFSSKDHWSFTAFENPAPIVTDLSPADDASDVNVDSDLMITFSETVIKGTTGSIVLRNSFGVGIEVIPVSSSAVSISSNVVSIDRTVPLDHDATYSVTLDAGSFKDVDNKDFLGINSWSFTTAPESDITAPALTSSSPTDNQTEVAVDANVILTFSEPITLSNASNVQLRRSDNSEVATSKSVSGSILTLNPSVNLDNNSIYYVYISIDAIEDTSGNNFAGITTNSGLNFTTVGPADIIPPSIASMIPIDDATDVDVTSNLTVTFDEEVQAGTGTIVIRKSDNSTVEVFSVTSGRVVFTGNTVTVDPTNNLENSTNYYVLIGSGAITDLAGNVYSGTPTTASWNFTTEAEEDITSPSIVSLSPADNATDVSLDSDLVLTADEPIFPPASGNILIKQATITVKTIPFTDATVDFTGSVLTISNALTDLSNNTGYWVNVRNVRDAAGNIMPETNAINWNFTTGSATDVVAPTLVVSNPLDNEIDVMVSSNIILTFSEEINLVNASNVQLRLSNNTIVNSTNTVSGSSITINPNSDLLYSTSYYVFIANGAVEDVAGNPFSGMTSSTDLDFTTEEEEDVTSPSIVSLSPADNSTDVSFDSDLVLTADEPIFPPASGNILIKQATATVKTIPFTDATVDFTGSVLTISDALTGLSSNTNYWVYVKNVQDAAGNILPETNAVNWNFTTTEELDQEGPILVTSTPSNGATNVGLNSSISLVFNENLVKSAGSIEVRRLNDDALLTSIGVNQTEISFTGNTLLLSGISFPANNTFYLQTVGDVFEDELGNKFDGFEKGDYTFTTISQTDSESPSFISLTPIDDEMQVEEEEPEISIEFDELIIAGSGNVSIFKYNTDELVQSFPVDGTEDSYEVDGTSIYLFSNDLEPATHYYITATAGIVKDWSGNEFDGILEKNDWDFTTTYNAIIWNGNTWSNGSGPSATDHVIIDEDYTFSEEGSFNCNELRVNVGSKLTVDGENTLVVNGDFANNGFVEVLSGSSLVNFSTHNFTGNKVSISRNTRYSDGKYSFVGSPVEQDLSIIGSDLGEHVYKYNETIPYGINDGLSRWEDASADVLIPGKGYTQAQQKEISFSGIPNSGTIIYHGTYTNDTDNSNEGWNLVANPYPAAISVSDFLAENTNITGAIYLWDDNGSDSQRGSNADYIVANSTMASATAAGGQTRYNFHLGSGQGFFVQLNNGLDTEISFRESMRVSGSNADDNFLRKEPVPIVRINLSNAEALFRQTVIGFAEDATNNQLNPSYDAKGFNAGAGNGIFTLKAGKSLSLSGVAPDWKFIQIQVNIAESGTYTITAEQEYHGGKLFLRDTKSGEIIDISAKPYSFFSKSGIYTDRFELYPQNRQVLTEQSETIIYSHEDILHIQQGDQSQRLYQVFNLQGQLVLSKAAQNSIDIEVGHLPKGIYLVFDGFRTHKVLLR